MAKKNIISASRRTDIPAFYSEWFMKRVQAGCCVYPNPMFPKKIYKVDLSPQAVDGIVFWTRNPTPLIPSLKCLDDMGYYYYFLLTVNGYPVNYEPRVPMLEKSIESFQKLSESIGANRTIWRYDPIILNHELTVDYHKKHIEYILKRLTGYTKKLIVSVVDPYRKTQLRIGTIHSGYVMYDSDAYLGLLAWLAECCQGAGIKVQSCAEPRIKIAGIVPGPCVDADLLAEISKRPVRKKQHKQRKGCCCHLSTDIGVNNTCGFGCVYCYATSNHEVALQHLKEHNPDSERMI